MKTKMIFLLSLLFLALNYVAYCDDDDDDDDNSSSHKKYVSVSDGNWNSKSNWDINKHPDEELDEGDTVLIYHDITFSHDLEIKGVIIVYSTGTLKKSGSKDVEAKDDGYIKMYGDLRCEDLEVDDDAIIDIYGSVQVDDEYDNDGTVNILSTSTFTGNLVIKGSKKNNSKVTLTRYVKKDGWHYISAPMTGIKMNKFWGAAVYSYDETTKTWDSHKANETMTPLKGYDVYFKSNHHSITFKGTPNDSAVNISLTYTSSIGDGYNLVGNPYCSAINWDASSGWTKTNINDAVYVWDDSLQNIATYINSVGINGGSNVIPPTMAFFVKCTSTSGGYLSVNKNAQVPDIEDFRVRPANNILRFRIGNERYYDETAIKFDNNASGNIDGWYDAEKMFSYNNQVPQCYTQTVNGEMLSVNSLPQPLASVEMPLYINIKTAGEYHFEIFQTDFDFDVDVLLEDVQTGNTIDLQSTNYEFYSDVVENQARFIIHFIPRLSIQANQNNLTTGMEETEVGKPNVYVNGQSLYVDFDVIPDNASITLLNVNGQVIKESFIKNPGTYRMDIPNSGNTAAYIVVINRDGILSEEKILVKP